jgi:hypothetical protein
MNDTEGNNPPLKFKEYKMEETKQVTQEEMNTIHDEWWDSLSDSDKGNLFQERDLSEEEFYGLEE